MASIKDLKRMCNTIECSKCDLLKWCEEDGRISELPDEADNIVDEWTKLHPVKTYMEDFFEKFPNAQTFFDGTPRICLQSLYDIKIEDCPLCTDCWNQKMDEGEKQCK